MLRFVSFSMALLTAAPVIAQTQPAPADAQKPAPTANKVPDRVICENQLETGSRIATNRVCMTAQEWKDHQLRTQSTLDQFHMDTQMKGGSADPVSAGGPG